MGDGPVARPALEAVHVPAAESLQVRAVAVTAAVHRLHVRFHVRHVRPHEIDQRVTDHVPRGLGVLTQTLRGVRGEVDAQAGEGAVIVRGIRVVHGGNQVRVPAVDAPAVLEQLAADGPLGRLVVVGHGCPHSTGIRRRPGIDHPVSSS